METTRTRTYTFAAVLSLVVIVGAIALLFLRDDSANDSIPPAPALESLSIHEAPTTDILELAAGTTADSDVPETETEPVEETPATVVPDGPPSLRGTITDLDGDPVEGAQVSLLDATGWQATTKDMESEMQGRGDPRDAVRLMREAFEAKFRDSPRAQSQEDGSYAFYGLPESEFRLFVSHEGYLRHAEGWAVVQSGSTFELNIELAPGYRVAGKVLDDKGRPVASASIAPVPAEEANQRSMGKLMRTFTTIVDGSFFLGAEPATTSTDGSFEIHSVEPIEYVLKTKASGWLPSEVPSTAGAKDVVIRLSSGGSVSGRVVNAAGDPVAAATWTMGPEFDVDMSNPMVFMQADIDFFEESVQTGTTGEDGTFKIQGLEPGSYDLKIRVEEHPTLASTMDVEGAIDVGDLVLEEARHIAGMVRGPDGSPVADARVWIPAEGGVRGPFNGGNRKIAESRSEGDGSFVLENLPEGTFEVHAASNDFAETSVKDVQAGDAGIELRLETGVSVAGRVLDATTREPIVDVKVTSPWARSKKTRTDERGDFFMRGISGRRLKQMGSDVRIFLVLQHPDYGMKTDQVQGQKEVPEALPEFLLEARMYLSGVVVDPDGEPVTGARLRFEVPGMPAAFTSFAGGDGMQGTSTARDGSFEVSPPVGNQFQRMGQMMQLTVSHPRYA
jgi:protocatechuate 3,4-dioxygenase beta subunit